MKTILLLTLFFSSVSHAYITYENGNYVSNEFSVSIICDEREIVPGPCGHAIGTVFTLNVESMDGVSFRKNSDINLDRICLESMQLSSSGTIQYPPGPNSTQQQCQLQQSAQQTRLPVINLRKVGGNLSRCFDYSSELEVEVVKLLSSKVQKCRVMKVYSTNQFPQTIP